MVPLDPTEACTRLLAALGDRAPHQDARLAVEQLSGWQFWDVSGAVVMIRGAEIHCAAPPERRGRWITRTAIRVVLGDILHRYGHALTSVIADNAAGHAFVQRLGFRPQGYDDTNVYYRLDN